MKVIFINKKRLGVTLIIVGLMFVLLAFEKNFDNRLKLTLLIQNDIKYLKQYTAMQAGITYKLPEEWLTKEENFSGGEIIYHNDFQTKDSKIHGFVQVLKMPKNLKQFLDESKIISSKQNLIYDYNISTIKVKDFKGYLVEYNMEVKSGENYKCIEYFLNDQGDVIRFSFFVNENNYKENMPAIFSTIVKTVDKLRQ